MKKTTYILAVENPCHEDWSNMSPSEQGRFCAQCSKCVVDFSQLSDKEILQIIQQKNGQKLCGRFSAEQLNRTLQNPSQTRKAHYSFLLAGLMLLGLADFSFAKPPLRSNTELRIQINNDQSTKEESLDDFIKDSSDYVVQGKITEATYGNSLSDVVVAVQNTKISTKSDKNGNYTITIPHNTKAKTFTLTFSNIGYSVSELQLEKRNLPIRQDVIMRINNMIMGKMVIQKTKK